MTYISVAFWDNVGILTTIDALNYIDAKLFDIGNVYLNADTYKGVCFINRKEFWPESYGKIIVADKAIYVLKAPSALFHKHTQRKLRERFGFQ